MPNRLFNTEQDALIAADYAAGFSQVELVAKWGGTTPSVADAARRGGATMRARVRRTLWVDAEADKAVAMWQGGVSVRELARTFQTRTTTITRLLEGRGLEPDCGPRIHKNVRGKDEEVATAYQDGSSLNELAKRYGCTVPTIKSALERVGVEARGLGVSRIWTDEAIAWACERYRAGVSQQAIADILGVSQPSVSNRLIQQGVVARVRKRRAAHHSWKGGRIALPRGYVGVKATSSDREFCTPNSSGYVAEHRLVMGRAIGRPLEAHETVHHINGDKTDNRLENLQLRSGNHGTGVARRCQDCGSHNIEDVPL